MRQRVVTAILLVVPALLALALRTPWPLAALGLAAAGVGGWEADGLLKTWGQVALASVALYVLAAVSFLPGPTPLLPPLGPTFPMVASCLGVAACLAPERTPALQVVRGFASLWVVGGLIAVLMLHAHARPTGTWILSPALMALVPVWAGDTAAIFAGRAFGKLLLAPKVSPKKTVEGSLANLLAAVLTAWLLGRLLGVADGRSLAAGVAVGVLGQAGDLFESWLKRRSEVKDSGTLLPGHGGALDRIDSVLFAAPAVALILLS